MRLHNPKPAASYIIALLTSVLAFGLTVALRSVMEPNPFLFFGVAVLISARIGGIGPGLAALAATTLGSIGFLLAEPPPDYWVPDPHYRILVYVGALGTLAWLMDAQLRAHRQAEDALRRLCASEAQYRRILETANEGIWSVDASGRTSYVNPRMAELLGCRADELPGRPFTDFVREEDADEVAARLVRRRERVGERYEVRLRRSDGTELYTSISATSIFDDAGEFLGTLGMITDITEQRKLEEELRQSQKMEAIGRLAGGVAHDFNNMLGVILGYTDLLQTRLGPADPTTPILKEIRKAGERAASLTRQLLLFSRKQPMAAEVLNLNEVVSAMEGLLLPLLGRDVKLEVRTDPNLGWVEADRGQVEQIVLNLAVNARDAMPDGGNLLLETRNVSRANGTGPASYVMLAVQDNGCGMDALTRSQIFEPFFTTKEKGKGTGLGLATVYGVVQQYHGHIEVESGRGQGSRFMVFLPQTRQPPVSKPAAPAAAPNNAAGTTVLVVDDEPMMRELAGTMLRAEGFHVFTAEDGEHALQLLQDRMQPIHLLLTDLVMPGMGGQELGERAAAVRPDVQILYMSGYAECSAGAEFRRRGLLVEKPFTPARLREGIRQALAGRK